MSDAAPAPFPPGGLALADGTVYRGAPSVRYRWADRRGVLQHQHDRLPGDPHRPSYAGQIVAMTYTQIGNVGANPRRRRGARALSPAASSSRRCSTSPATGAPRRRSTRSSSARRPGIAGHRHPRAGAAIRDGGAQNGRALDRPGAQDAATRWSRARQAPGPRRTRPGRRGDLPTRPTRGRGRLARHRRPAPAPRAPPSPSSSSPTTSGSSATSCACWSSRASTSRSCPATTPAEALALSPTPSSSRTARAIRPPSRACGSTCALAASVPDLRHLPRPPDPRASPSAGRPQAQVRPPRRQPARPGPRDGQGGDLRREPRLRRRRGLAARAAGEPVEVTHVNLNDGTVEGLAHESGRSSRSSTTRRRRRAPRRRLLLRALPRDGRAPQERASRDGREARPSAARRES